MPDAGGCLKRLFLHKHVMSILLRGSGCNCRPEDWLLKFYGKRYINRLFKTGKNMVWRLVDVGSQLVLDRGSGRPPALSGSRQSEGVGATVQWSSGKSSVGTCCLKSGSGADNLALVCIEGQLSLLLPLLEFIQVILKLLAVGTVLHPPI